MTFLAVYLIGVILLLMISGFLYSIHVFNGDTMHAFHLIAAVWPAVLLLIMIATPFVTAFYLGFGLGKFFPDKDKP